MSFDKQIQDKFSGFEPEVPEEHINAGWEKIKYFLPPEEKKKRGFFFYRLPKGMGIAAVVAIVITLSVGILFMQEQGKRASISALQRNMPTLRAVDLNSAGIYHDTSTPHPEKNTGLETAHAGAAAFGMKQAYKIPVAQHTTQSLSITRLSSHRSATADVLKNTSGTADPNPGTSDPTDQEAFSASPHTEPDTNRDPVTSGFMMLLKQASLYQEAPFAPDLNPELSLLSLDRVDPPLPTKRRPALELFSGYGNRSFLLQTVQEKSTLGANGFSAGMAEIFPVAPKLYVGAQFIFSYNPLQYREETGANAVVKRAVVASLSSSLTNYKDTFVYYVPYRSTFELESNTSYHLSGGVGYQLLNKGRISLDGALFLDFSLMRLNYRTNRVSSDTGIFINNILTSPADVASFYKSVETPAASMPVSGKKHVMSLGVNPCLSLVYRLNKKTELMLRPAYMIQLSQNTLEANGKSYRLKENNWFINLGVRRTF